MVKYEHGDSIKTRISNMSGAIRELSLLPFLQRNPGMFRMRFPFASQDPEVLSHSSFPFLLISDSDPVARIVAAHVETDRGDRLATLFFLVQKDRYRLDRESLHPVTNLGIEEAWQRAGAAYRDLDERRAPRLFEGQRGSDGILVPFAPVFFCKEKERYFHPPCPGCGRPLGLCRDDAVLAAAGLPVYSGSIERYLFCDSCAGSPGGNFYALETGSGAPPVLRDRITLVRNFGRVGADSSGETAFPCPACPERESCYGPSLKALARVVPFSFYPFHAFAFEAMSLCASDFLALLSGARPEELAKRLESSGERGRAALVRAEGGADPLLFEGGDRRFLEILYLKLALLQELFDSLGPGKELPGPPDFRPSVDRAWVSLGAARDPLPRYWNFRAAVLDIGQCAGRELSRGGAPGRDDLLFLGVAWFEALLANAKQDGVAVRSALSERLGNPLPAEGGTFPGATDPRSAFFAGNLFFHPADAPSSAEAARVWERTLSTGWAILAGGVGRGKALEREAIRADIRALRDRVRALLFEVASPGVSPGVAAEAAGPRPAQEVRTDVRATADPEDAAIASILDAILAKWSSVSRDVASRPAPSAPEVDAAPSRPRSAPPPGDDFLVKTVVLGAQPGAGGSPRISPTSPEPAPQPRGTEARRPAAAPAPGAPAAPPSAEDTIEKTMILRPGGDAPASARAAAPAPGAPAAPPSAEDTIEKTMILRPGGDAPASARGAASAPGAPAAPPPAEDTIEKTMILRPGGSAPVPVRGAASAPGAPAAPPPDAPDADADLEKTVILKPPAGGGKQRRQGR